MKKSIICTSILALICLLAFSGLAAAMKIDGPHEMNRQEPPLYDQYPCVGVDDVSVYYIDPSSCYASLCLPVLDHCRNHGAGGGFAVNFL